MSSGQEATGRPVPSWLWLVSAVQLVAGVVLLLVGPAWVGLTLVGVTVIGLLPLALESRRQRG